jgi:hypothetical protein
MSRVVIAYLFFLLLVSQTMAAAVFSASERGSRAQLIESAASLNGQFDEMKEIKPSAKAAIGSCRIKGIKTQCALEDGGFIAVRALPVLPGRLFRFIQSGNGQPRPDFEYNRELFWTNIRNYVFTGDSELLNPLEHQWAVSEKVWWVDVERDRDAREIQRLWNEISKSLENQNLNKLGLFLLKVNHNDPKITSSLQVCWMFFNKSDPLADKCTAVVVEREGKTFVRFLKGYYQGGYAFEPANYFVCSTSKTLPGKDEKFSYASDVLKVAFGQSPFNLAAPSEERGENSRYLRFIRKFELSDVFPGYRESVDIRLEIDLLAEGADNSRKFGLDLVYSFFISKQNSNELSELTLPNDAQVQYYDSKIVQFIQSKLDCQKRKRFF